MLSWSSQYLDDGLGNLGSGNLKKKVYCIVWGLVIVPHLFATAESCAFNLNFNVSIFLDIEETCINFPNPRK